MFTLPRHFHLVVFPEDVPYLQLLPIKGKLCCEVLDSVEPDYAHAIGKAPLIILFMVQESDQETGLSVQTR